ncbi:sigma-54 dependent transcriptional regulator [Paucibacter sp. B2R-40]|uniref:sigma-54 interaction domain-containing protein n=1 Tax=Paucibacter sp. B2R-40 TaxID=2893554 RepID=UPI0021E368E5|nr:sigma-54 dependent transcriptional regulator [Paucibacter sp. B2R-40]MCV2355655.1 sigma-54 dependent transcriptional regulator [Paucibacter sp. B2R-40]
MPSTLLTLPDPQALSIRAKALVFEDPISKALLAEAELVAASEATVLITGETGTGKELIARHVHACSGRVGPFVAVNCGAFSDNMVEAELFGHESGAYTGALQARAGWFETARGGTLFLDEIGDLPLQMQVKLLRVLQERQVVRLGSRKAIDVDVRLVAATNVDLAQAVEAGHFRRDLFYRLNIATLHLPPLAQRPADIRALAEHFIALYSKRLGRGPVRLSDAAYLKLLGHDWPGNIRELENVIHSALITGRGDELRPEALNLHSRLGRSAPSPSAQASSATEVLTQQLPAAADSSDKAPLDLLRAALEAIYLSPPNDLFALLEREIVQAAFTHVGRNQVHAAELLGVSRNILRAQLKRAGLLADSGRSANHAAPAFEALTDDDCQAA